MKKTIFLSPLFFFLLATPVLAAKLQTGRPQTEDSVVQSVNQVDDVVVETPETEINLEVIETTEVIDDNANEPPSISSGKNSRSQNAYQHISRVAQSVEVLLETKIQGGIGEQVKEIARQQNESQEQIQQNLNEVESRPGWLKKLFGADKKTVKNLNGQITQNQLRLEQLAEVQTQLINQSDLQTVQLAVETLTDQNTALQQVLEEEQQIKGIFSWLTALFAR